MGDEHARSDSGAFGGAGGSTDEDFEIPVYEPGASEQTNSSDDLEIPVYDTATTDSFAKQEPITVGVAEYAITTGQQPLRTSGLGSCIAVAIVDSGANVGGLLHFMLPKAAESNGRDHDAGKFADTGLTAMFHAFQAAGGDPNRTTARIVGGAAMITFTYGDRPVGERNVHAARSLLRTYDVPIVGEEVGGDTGRSVTFDVERDELVIKRADGTQKLL